MYISIFFFNTYPLQQVPFVVPHSLLQYNFLTESIYNGLIEHKSSTFTITAEAVLSYL